MAKTVRGLIQIFRYLMDRDVKMSKKLLFLVPVLYLFFPFDLITDFFPLAGQLDDVAVFVLMWPILKSFLSDYNQESGSGGKYGKKRQKDAIDMSQDDYEVE